MSTNLKYRARETQRKRESRWQASKDQRERGRQRSRARDKKQTKGDIFFVRGTTWKFCNSSDKMRNASGHQCKVKMAKNFAEYQLYWKAVVHLSGGGGCAPLHPPPSSAPKTPLSKYSHANLLLAATQNAKNKSQPTGGLFWEEVVSHLLFGREFITWSF